MNKKACEDAIARLYPYLDGELTTYRRWAIRRHLKACSPCGSAFSFEDKLKRVVKERTREEVPDEVIGRLQEFLRTEEPGIFGD